MDMDLVRRYAELKDLAAQKKSDLDVTKKELEELQAQLLEQFAEDGVASMGVKIGSSRKTIYTARMLVATNLKGPEATAEACRRAGLEEMVKETVNANTLSAYVRQMEEAGEPLPDAFEGVVGTFEKFTVGVRSS